MPQVRPAVVRITTTALSKSMVDVGAELGRFLRETVGVSVSDLLVGEAKMIQVKIGSGNHAIKVYRPAARNGAFRRLSLTRGLSDALKLEPDSLMQFEWDGTFIRILNSGKGEQRTPDEVSVDDRLMPDSLIHWSGSAKGGVHVLFAPDAGNPAGKVLETELIRRITNLAKEIVSGKSPRIVLLAGGAGNGKTHAVEALIRGVIADDVSAPFSQMFLERARKSRVVELSPSTTDAAYFGGKLTHYDRIRVVQDASETDKEGNPPHRLFLQQIQNALTSSRECLIACANRGVLYAAAREAASKYPESSAYLAEVIRCLDPLSVDRDCWPMRGAPDSYLWPLDIESVCESEPGRDPAALAVLDALDAASWADLSPFGAKHPLVVSRGYLMSRDFRKALVRLMRDYEMATGKNLTFRKVFSACSYLFSGGRLNGDPRPMKKAAALKTDDVEVAIEEDGALAYEAYEQSLAFLLFPSHPDVDEFRTRLQGLEGGESLRFLDVIADRVEQLRERIDLASRHPGGAIFADERSAWSVYADPCRVKFGQREQDAIIQAGLTGELRELPQLVSLDLKKVVSLMEGKCDPATVRLLRWLARCDQELGKEVERTRQYELQWFARWISKYASMLAKRAIALEVMRGGGTVSPASVDVDAYRTLMHDNDKKDEFVVRALSVMFGSDINDTEHHVISLASGLCRPPSPIRSAARFEFASQPSGSLPVPSALRPPASCLVLDINFEDGRAYRVPLTLQMHGMICSVAKGLLPGSLPPSVRASIDAMRMRQDGHVLRISKKAKLLLPGRGAVTVQKEVPSNHAYINR